MSNNFFPKIVPFSWDNVEKHDTARQVTEDNTVDAEMLFACQVKTTRIHTHTHTLITFIAYCFCTTTQVT
jgi:hypothetical protein